MSNPKTEQELWEQALREAQQSDELAMLTEMAAMTEDEYDSLLAEEFESMLEYQAVKRVQRVGRSGDTETLREGVMVNLKSVGWPDEQHEADLENLREFIRQHSDGWERVQLERALDRVSAMVQRWVERDEV